MSIFCLRRQGLLSWLLYSHFKYVERSHASSVTFTILSLSCLLSPRMKAPYIRHWVIFQGLVNLICGFGLFDIIPCAQIPWLGRPYILAPDILVNGMPEECHIIFCFKVNTCADLCVTEAYTLARYRRVKGSNPQATRARYVTLIVCIMLQFCFIIWECSGLECIMHHV